jgi:hypothetical protein
MAKAKKTRPAQAPRSAKESYMTGLEYRKALSAVGLSVRNSRHFFGCSESSAFRRAGGSAITFEIAALLRVMVKYGISPETVTDLTRKRG